MWGLKYNLLLMILLFFSIFMGVNVNSLYYSWIFLEMNVLLFLTFLIVNSDYVSVISMKYYLMGSFSSIIFIYIINLNLIKNEYLSMILNLMMLMKLGVIPFHWWFIDMMLNLTWFLCFFLMTLQKLIPLLILSFIYNNNLIKLISILGGLIGLMLTFNQVLVKKIMGYSSVNHMFWMMMSLLIKFNLWLFYYMNYLLLIMILLWFFSKFNIEELYDFYLIYKYMNLGEGLLLILMMLSLGGLPPFYGFFLKWFMINYMVMFNMYLLLFLLIIYSLIFLYFYMRFVFNMMMNGSLQFNFLNLFFIKLNNFNYLFFMFLFVTLNLILFFFLFMLN